MPNKKSDHRPDIRTINNMLAEGKTVKEIADFYGCTTANIYAKIKSVEKKLNPKADLTPIKDVMYDEENKMVVATKDGRSKQIIAAIGDERVTAFVNYHIEMMAMRQGVDRRNVPDLYQRFYRYLDYCAEHGIMPNNMNAYYAIGVNKQTISLWKLGQAGTPEHQKFAEDITQFFASVHEQGAQAGLFNPISSIFWQKAYDGLIEASKLEVVQQDPLGDKRSAEDIAKAYTEVNLPD